MLKFPFRIQRHQLLLLSFGALPHCGLDSEARACILLPLCARSYLSSLSLPWKSHDSILRGCSEEERHSHPEKYVEGPAHCSCSRELHQGTLPGGDSSHWSLLISALLLFACSVMRMKYFICPSFSKDCSLQSEANGSLPFEGQTINTLSH